MNSMREAFDCLGTPRILVLGDLMLDRYIWADAERISPEAPVMVLRTEREEVRLGGAASVASLLRALQCPATLAGVIGDDGPGRVVQKLLRDDGIDHNSVSVDDSRLTTSKERYMGRAANRRPQQIFRVDREDRRVIDANIEASLTDAVVAAIPQHAAVLISDYAKGVCTPLLLARVIEAANHHSIPVFVDPARIDDYARYRGATALMPNRHEAEMAAGRRIRTPEDALTAGQWLSERTEIPFVLVKLDCDGMILVSNEKPDRRFSTRPRAVQDVTGAGDMVLAMAGLCRASGLSWDATVPLANLAAGLEVERFGVAAVSRADIAADIGWAAPSRPNKVVSLETGAALADAYRKEGKTLVLTNGCFDLLHVGHVGYLREAARLGDVLIVAVNSDESVRRLKGPTRPVINQEHRAAMLAALECVRHVLIFDEDTPHRLLAHLQPSVLVKGGTYSVDEVVGKEIVLQYGGRVFVTGKLDGVSTTEILSGLRKATCA
jgi:D-beta-D-heptose 7-phosphate kinase / D-beta-D-heptose 1-phosphate adenosyltransferase